MTRVKEINVKIVYEIPDTRDPRLVRFRAPLAPVRLHDRGLHISGLTLLLPSPLPSHLFSSLLFSNCSATMTSLNVARHSYEPVRAATPSRETTALHGAIWLAHL